MPSKALIAAGHAASAPIGKKAEAMLGTSGGLKHPVDGTRVGQHIAEVREKVYSQESPEVLEAELGIEIVFGEASFEASRVVRIAGDRKVTYYKLVVCTGSAPRVPASVKTVNYDTNETIFEHPPASGDSLAVVGGGPIGSELAQACARLGAKVFVFARRGLLPRERPEARAVVVRTFEDEGVEVIEADVEQATTGPNGKIDIVAGGKTRSFDRLLVAAGRRPVVPKSLDVLGVQTDENGGIMVNRRTLACAPNVYAAGDCIGGAPQFTHVAGYHGYLAARNALLPGNDDASDLLNMARVPRVTFTSPEVGSVGLAEPQAVRDALGVPEHRIELLKWRTEANDRALTEREDPDCFVELVLLVNKAKSTATVVGGTVVSERAGELLSEIALAAHNKLSTAQIGKTVHPYPTHAFVIQNMCSRDATARFIHHSRLGRFIRAGFQRTRIKKEGPQTIVSEK